MEEYINNMDHIDNIIVPFPAWITCVNIETVIKVYSILYWFKLEIRIGIAINATS